jgi:hypothetical protein
MRRRAAWIAGLSLGLPLLLYLALRVGLWTPFINLALSWQLKGRTPVQVRIGALRSNIHSFLEADDVVVLAPVGTAKLPLLTIASLRLEYRGWYAWRGRVNWDEALSLARIRGLSVFLLREADGSWNLSGLGGPRGASPTAKPAKPFALPLLPASRVELEDSQVVLNDEARGFHTSIDSVQGSLDTRALPLLAFSLNGRTEGKQREDLSIAGELDERDGSLFSRLDLNSVPLARYLNYFLPTKGLRFESGSASLSVRLRRQKGGDLDASGRAELLNGSVRIPGIADPLTDLQGAVAFDPASLRFKRMQARFLDSEWTVSGAIQDLRHPRFELSLQNPGFGLWALSQQVHGLSALALSGTASVEASLSGPAVQPVVEARLGADRLGLFGAELEAVSASARLQGRRLEVPSLRGRLWGGQLAANAGIGLGPGGRLRAELDLRGADLTVARLRGIRPLPLSGTASLKLKASGLLKAPELDLDLGVQGSSLGELPLGALDAHAAWSPTGFSSRFDGADGRLKGRVAFSRGKSAAFKDSKIELSGMDLAKLAHGLATAGTSLALPAAGVRTGAWLEGRLGGVLRAALSFEGPLKTPAIWIDAGLQDGRLFLGDGLFELKKPEEGLPLGLRGQIGFHQGEIMLGRQGQPLRLGLNRRGKGVEVLALGRFPLRNDGKSGKLELALSGDLKFLDAFQLFDDSAGRLNADLVLAGTPGSPLATGDLTVKGFSTKPSAYLAPIKGGDLEMQFRGQRVDIAQLRLKAGGELTATGSLDLSAGLKGMEFRLEARTDDEGLRIENWEGMGNGNLVLAPLVVAEDGEGMPLRVEGRARLSNALIVYAGKPHTEAEPGAPPPPARRPLALDLRIGLGSNVWYEKRQTGGVDLFDLGNFVSDLTNSVRDTLQRPGVFFRLRPTDEDIAIRSGPNGIQLTGELAIDRGRLTLMDNDYEIRTDRSPATVRFNGRQAEVRAVAVGRLRYTRDNALTGRPEQRAVNVLIQVQPLDQDDLERSGLANAFLNYSLSFSADPEIPEVAADKQSEAVLNLVVLGDPMVDLQQSQGGGQAEAAAGAAQISRLVSGQLRGIASKLSKKGFKFLGTQVFDVLRVVPRFKYQTAGSAPAPVAGQSGQSSQTDQLVYSDLSVELGKSLTEKLYSSLQLVNFGESSRSEAQASASNGGRVMEVRPGGFRAGLEYQVAPNRTIETYWNWSTDDNLEPLPFDPTRLEDAQSIMLRMRNTIPTDNYSPELARRRRWQGTPTPEPR